MLVPPHRIQLEIQRRALPQRRHLEAVPNDRHMIIFGDISFGHESSVPNSLGPGNWDLGLRRADDEQTSTHSALRSSLRARRVQRAVAVRFY
jgi:hypothetical protein